MAAAAPAPAAAPDPAAEPSPPAAKAASPIGASPIGRESVHTHTSGDAAANAAYYAEFKPRFALGRGQFGVAYLLQHKDGHKAVDKRIHLDGLKEEDRANTWKEIELLRRLTHEGVVAFYHSFETEEEGGGGGEGGPGGAAGHARRTASDLTTS